MYSFKEYIDSEKYLEEGSLAGFLIKHGKKQGKDSKIGQRLVKLGASLGRAKNRKKVKTSAKQVAARLARKGTQTRGKKAMISKMSGSGKRKWKRNVKKTNKAIQKRKREVALKKQKEANKKKVLAALGVTGAAGAGKEVYDRSQGEEQVQ